MNKKLYVVVRKNPEIVEDVIAVFDELETAESFIDRFKSGAASPLTITERELNPEFHSDQTKNPYCVIFSYDSDTPEDCFQIDDLKEATPEYEYVYYDRKTLENVTLFVTIIAISEITAIRQAKALRDNLIKSGDWEKSWLDHQAAIV